jgi:tRNA A37 methylthiotransferase MiaB
MRGCPCRCYFCTEPQVKGRKPYKRDIEVILQDVAFLADRDVRCVWFICSELNMAGMSFPREFAARMQAFNADRGSRRVLWKAYNMPQP